MALHDITRNAVEKAIREFGHLGLENMCERYGGKPSRKWYVQYCKKIIIRNFYCELTHQLDELGPLPPGRKSFKARQARQHLQHLGFVVVGVPCSLVTNSSHRDHRKREINYNSSDI